MTAEARNPPRASNLDPFTARQAQSPPALPSGPPWCDSHAGPLSCFSDEQVDARDSSTQPSPGGLTMVPTPSPYVGPSLLPPPPSPSCPLIPAVHPPDPRTIISLKCKSAQIPASNPLEAQHPEPFRFLLWVLGMGERGSGTHLPAGHGWQVEGTVRELSQV